MTLQDSPLKVTQKSPVQNRAYIVTGDKNVDTGREPVQMGWYEFAAEFCRSKVVVDVGCGMGEGLRVLQRTSSLAYGIDLDPRLEREDIRILRLEDLPTDSVDVVVCIDVIEHVEEDLQFAEHLVRVAREQVLVSTPNWTVSRCRWPYHVREYMPHELLEVFRAYGTVEPYKGTLDGRIRFPVRYPRAYSTLNRLRIHPVTQFPARIVNHILPPAARIQCSQFVRVLL